MGADCLDALLNPPEVGDQQYRAKRYAGALMLTQLYETIVSEPRRSLDAVKAIMRSLGQDVD